MTEQIKSANIYLMWGAATLLFFGLSVDTFAQQADSTDRSFFVNPKPESFTKKAHTERQTGTFALPESGIMSVPDETQYYQLPFKGQYYLDLAVEAYREEQKDQFGSGWMGRFLQAIAPFVNHGFQFGHYQIYDMPLTDRDNPLYKSHNNPEKRE